MPLVNNQEAILVWNSLDAKSRDFYGTLTPLQLSGFQSIIDWYNVSDRSKVEDYLDRHLPTNHDMPWVLAFIPWGHHNYTGKWQPYWVDHEQKGWHKQDECALITPPLDADGNFLMEHFTYDAICSATIDSTCEAIIENVQMSESYKVSYLKKQFMLNAKIKVEALMYLNTCKTVHELQVMYSRLGRESMLVNHDADMIEQVKEHIDVELGEIIKLNVPSEPAPIPAYLQKDETKHVMKLIEAEAS